ncbi:hypothetical protein [Caldalkalibacillus salinus]|uniref:hypothetical protein n=1 Tax=Caldalkalibacillus salinus TaxID=2803787 RepID=UPI001921165F|nr:hypothetical protein [Caldalkalibacillus salinus]
MNQDQWTRYLAHFEVHEDKKVQDIDVRMIVHDVEGEVSLTDLQLQEGGTSTGHSIANREMLKREQGSGGRQVRQRHYNAVIRGEKTIGIPNRALPSEENVLEHRVTGGMDYTIRPSQGVPSEGLLFSHFHRTRTFTTQRVLEAEDVLRFKATTREVSVNGNPIHQYSGAFHTVPGMFGKFHVQLKSTQNPGEWTGSGYLLCEVDTWLQGHRW